MSFVADLTSNTLPILIVDQDQVCSTMQYIDRNGRVCRVNLKVKGHWLWWWFVPNLADCVESSSPIFYLRTIGVCGADDGGQHG
jgi:hypothetical protein